MKKKKAFFTIIGLSLFFLVHEFCDRATDGFCLQKVLTQPFVFEKKWDAPPLTSIEQQSISLQLDQPYTFLGMGSECFTFISQDKKTVLKLFKQDQMRFLYFKRAVKKEDHADYAPMALGHWLKDLPLPSFLHYYRDKVVGLRCYRLYHTFDSCNIAWEKLKEETALTYIHLNPTKNQFNKALTLYDKIGIRYEIDLDSTRFVLQKTANLVYPTLEELIQSGQIEKAKEHIDSLISLIRLRCEKGIGDRDALVGQNFGFVDGKAIEIDIGSFSYNEKVQGPYVSSQIVKEEIKPLLSWLKKRSKPLYKHLKAQIKE